MKTRNLTFALLLIVAIFVTKGYYVTQDVREAAQNSYREFELVANVVGPLMDSYEVTMIGNQVKASHSQSAIKELDGIFENTQSLQKKLLAEYIEACQGKETANDKELVVRAHDIDVFIDKMQVICRAGDVEALHKTLYTGEMYGVFEPALKCLNRISESKLKSAEKYKSHVVETLDTFNKVVMIGVSLLGILFVLLVHSAANHKEPRKKNLKKKTRAVNKIA